MFLAREGLSFAMLKDLETEAGEAEDDLVAAAEAPGEQPASARL